MVISSLIDRARAAMGWGALPQTSVPGQQSPQDLAIISWFEICHDAGMRLEQYTPCYRAAQQRKKELVRQGKELTIVTPHDLCAELDNIRLMHAELDKTRMLPEHAAGACVRCFGTGFERMPDGSVRPGCPHVPLTAEEERAMRENRERDSAFVRDQVEFMREALKNIGSPKPPAEPKKDERGVRLQCDSCPRKVWTVFGFEAGGRCGDLLNRGTHTGELKFCEGKFEVAG